jgi:hypothetical protein
VSPEDKDRLRKMFAMLQSPYENEAMTATRMIKQILQANGKTINDLIGELDWEAPAGNNRYNYQPTKSSSPPPPPTPDPPPNYQQHTSRPDNSMEGKAVVAVLAVLFSISALGAITATLNAASDIGVAILLIAGGAFMVLWPARSYLAQLLGR